MLKRDASYLVLGILITAVASCRPPSENPLTTVEPEWVEASPDAAAMNTGPPATEPPRPSPLPTLDEWPTLGSTRAGLSLAIPPTWIDMTDHVSAPAMGNRLGINLVFAADSERTGRSLLAGKSFANGAYVSGLIVSPLAMAADPVAVLVDLLENAAPSAVRLTEIAPINSANGVAGLVVDVGDGPIGLNIPNPSNLRTRVALYMPHTDDIDTPSSWIALLLSASTGRWEQHVESFDRMLASVNVYDTRPGAAARTGDSALRGELAGDRAQVTANIESGVSDLWTFYSSGGRYASIFLEPHEPYLDLGMTLVGPNRQTTAQFENGFAGAIESAADVWLAEAGIYIVEVSEFAQASGRYTISLFLSNEPQYNDGGTLAFGQALQGYLPAGGQHQWVFSGIARQRISIVVEPDATNLDAILELYGSNGEILVSLDEGFSGDPELISSFELPAAGEFAIVVRSFSPQGGPYTISLAEGGRSIANFHDAGDLSYGSVRQETLQRQEAHAWFFQARAGDHVLIRATPLGVNLDLDVWLLDNNVERVATADEFTTGEPETIERTLSADGQYIVLVRDFNGEPGEYEIALGAAPTAMPETAGELAYGDAIIGMVAPGVATAWAFEAQAGDVIDIDIQPGDASSDLVVRLQGPDGLTALEMDQSSAGGDEAIRAYALPAGGQWLIIIREFFGESASYRLGLARAR